MWAGIFGAMVLLIPVLVLLLPIHLCGRIDVRVREIEADESGFAAAFDALAWKLQLSWAWGLLHLHVQGDGLLAPTKEARVLGLRLPSRRSQSRPTRGAKPKGASQKPSTRKRGRRIRFPGLSSSTAVAGEVRRFLIKLRHTLRLRMSGHLTYGLEDPALTGMAQAALAATPLPSTLTLIPDYADAGVDGWTEIEGRFHPGEVVYAVLITAWKQPIRRIWWKKLRATLRRSKS